MVSCFGLFGVNSEFNDLKDHRLYVFSYGTVKPFHFGVPHFGMGPYGDQKAHRVQDSPIHRFTAQELHGTMFPDLAIRTAGATDARTE
jgi:hypothetical protein